MPLPSPAELEQFLGELRYERDQREAPNPDRRSHFLTGWRDCAEGRREYSAAVLDSLTWQNLGFRFARRFDSLTEEEALDAYDIFASLY